MKELKQYPGYLITEDGKLFSKKSNRFLKGRICSGYLRYEMGRRKNQYAHRLVALAYIPNPDDLPQINHINEDKLDNRVDNLEWCTSAYNTVYSCAKDWKVITPKGETVDVTNLRKYCRDNNINASHMISVGKTKGYRLIRP